MNQLVEIRIRTTEAFRKSGISGWVFLAKGSAAPCLQRERADAAFLAKENVLV